MSGACDWFELVQYVESFDMGINFLEGPPGPPGPAGEAIFIPSVSEDGVLSWTNTAGLPNPDPIDLSGPAGTTDYRDLTNKPSINGVTLSGNKTTADLQISTVNLPVSVSDGGTGANNAAAARTNLGLGNVANERQYSAQNPPLIIGPTVLSGFSDEAGFKAAIIAAIRSLQDGQMLPIYFSLGSVVVPNFYQTVYTGFLSTINTSRGWGLACDGFGRLIQIVIKDGEVTFTVK